MPKKYSVFWSGFAENDLASIIDYISEENIDNALDVLLKIKRKAESLKNFPYRGRIVPELLKHNINFFREIIIFPWRIIYRIEDTDVYVLSVFDGRRNIEDILLKRLLKI